MVRRRWGRKEQGDPAPPRDPTEGRSHGGARPTAEDADDLESRLTEVTSSFQRPPTADELRAAFSRRHPDDEPPLPREDSFTEQFPTESLFVQTDDAPEVEEVHHSEDRSRTTGDYYYDPEDAWAVLGLPSGASWKEIAGAHRRLAMRHHPDRLLDAPAEERARSEETMREVNVAYNVLRRLTGH